MFNGIFRGFAVFSRKDNIKGEQELSSAILFNLKLWRIVRLSLKRLDRFEGD